MAEKPKPIWKVKKEGDEFLILDETGVIVERLKRQPCEVWDRIVGYHRPKSSFNPAQKQYHDDRKTFKEPKL